MWRRLCPAASGKASRLVLGKRLRDVRVVIREEATVVKLFAVRQVEHTVLVLQRREVDVVLPRLHLKVPCVRVL